MTSTKSAFWSRDTKIEVNRKSFSNFLPVAGEHAAQRRRHHTPDAGSSASSASASAASTAAPSRPPPPPSPPWRHPARRPYPLVEHRKVEPRLAVARGRRDVDALRRGALGDVRVDGPRASPPSSAGSVLASSPSSSTSAGDRIVLRLREERAQLLKRPGDGARAADEDGRAAGPRYRFACATIAAMHAASGKRKVGLRTLTIVVAQRRPVRLDASKSHARSTTLAAHARASQGGIPLEKTGRRWRRRTAQAPPPSPRCGRPARHRRSRARCPPATPASTPALLRLLDRVVAPVEPGLGLELRDGAQELRRRQQPLERRRGEAAGARGRKESSEHWIKCWLGLDPRSAATRRSNCRDAPRRGGAIAPKLIGVSSIREVHETFQGAPTHFAALRRPPRPCSSKRRPRRPTL